MRARSLARRTGGAAELTASPNPQASWDIKSGVSGPPPLKLGTAPSLSPNPSLGHRGHRPGYASLLGLCYPDLLLPPTGTAYVPNFTHWLSCLCAVQSVACASRSSPTSARAYCAIRRAKFFNQHRGRRRASVSSCHSLCRPLSQLQSPRSKGCSHSTFRAPRAFESAPRPGSFLLSLL